MKQAVQKIEEIRLNSRLKDALEQLSVSVANATEEQKRTLLEILEDWQHGHRREHSRKSCSVYVDFATEGSAFSGAIKNLSMNGLFIETSEQFLPGQIITLTFSLPNHPKPFKTNAKVVRQSARGVGVQFKLPSKYLEELLKAKIEAL